MHNSLYLRERLAATNSDPMRLERRDPHRLVMRDPAAVPEPDTMTLEDAWAVTCAGIAPEVARLLADDMRDFLGRMGVSCDDTSPQRLHFTLVDDLQERDCRYACHPGEVDVEAGGVAGLWAGVAWLEWEMRTRRGPFLPLGVFERRAAWPVQISQGPWGGNYSVPDFSPEYLDDDAFRLYAHYGVNSMMIYGDLLCYIDSAILPELNHPEAGRHFALLREAAQRAARYGVKFSYVVVGAKLRPDHPVFLQHPEVKGTEIQRPNRDPLCYLCSSSEVTLAFYQEAFTRLCREAPELAGFVLILYAESFYHCRMCTLRPSCERAGVDPAERDRTKCHCTPCARCGDGDPNPMLARLVGAVQRGVREADSSAYVAAWLYSYLGDHAELFRQMPEGIAVFHAIEKDGYYPRDGYRKLAWDYSVDCAGPSPTMSRLATEAHADGRPLFVKTETGIGLEVFQFPYVPALQQLARKWQGVRELHPQGVHQSWLFFGMFGSRAEELGLWAAYGQEITDGDFLRRMAERDFGPAAEAVVEAWAQMSEAVAYLPFTCLAYYYIGPSFLGPAHPLVPERGAAIPAVFDGYLYYLQEAEETFSVRPMQQARTCLVMDELPDTLWGMEPDDPAADFWAIAACEYERAAAAGERAWRGLQRAVPLTRTAADEAHLREELLLTELVYRTMLSCAHTIRFLMARRDYERGGDPGARATMQAVARAERENALAALPIYRDARWLDLAERTDGIYTPCAEMIAEKVRWIDRFLSIPETEGAITVP